MSAHDQLNGNGHHQKAFSITPSADPLTFDILDARHRVLEWQRRRKGQQGLNTSEKTFFCHILDLSLDKRVNVRPGVVIISETRLAQTFNVSTRTIYSWKMSLVSTGEVWLSKHFRPNMWPCDVYHIAAIDAPNRPQQPAQDGHYGAGGTRSVPQSGLGARTPGQPRLNLPGSKSRPHPDGEQLVKTPLISGDSRNSLRVSPEENFGSHPKNTSGDTRKILRVTPEENFGREPKKTSGETRSKLRASTEANFRYKRGSDRRIEPLEVNGDPVPPVQDAFEVWRNGLANLLPSALPKLRQDFVEKVRSARSEGARLEYKRRLAVVEELIYGPAVPDAPAPPGPKPKTATIAKRTPTRQELLDGALYLMSVGQEGKLTDEQRRLLDADNKNHIERKTA